MTKNISVRHAYVGMGIALLVGVMGGASLKGSIDDDTIARLHQDAKSCYELAERYRAHHEQFLSQLPNYQPDWVSGLGEGPGREEWMIQEIREHYKK